jgi:hypothetical protein
MAEATAQSCAGLRTKPRAAPTRRWSEIPALRRSTAHGRGMPNTGLTTDAQPTAGRPAFKPGQELASYSLTLYRRPGASHQGFHCGDDARTVAGDV